MKENSIEKDIEIINSIDCLDDIELKQAIAHILSDHKRILKENEELNKHISFYEKNGSYKERIIELKEINERLEKENKELKEKAFFMCDPSKNKKCKKTSCHINNGECMLTTDMRYSKKYKN